MANPGSAALRHPCHGAPAQTPLGDGGKTVSPAQRPVYCPTVTASLARTP
ncbi:hypothetical protein SAMN04488105_12912 [Salipiger thiooxidans]|uniref:Uncharacterized protein n=1 Tax=Salipiger thiooxidans TaxID=282683 RepID=A0A1G7M2F5_9RHOB|nr:hypothetical protein SAMN04488105_12912 [Salipiger thiooxidans]